MADGQTEKTEAASKDKKVTVRCRKFPSLQAVVGNTVIVFRGGVAEVTPEQAKALMERDWIDKP